MATFHGAKVYRTVYDTWAAQDFKPLASFNAERFDTDNYHFTSSAALTGTVDKAASSPNLVGHSTLFLSELSVNQVITIPGTADEVGVVRSISNDTALVLWQTMANTATGQTAVRRSSAIGIPAGFPGYYDLIAGTFINKTPFSDAPISIRWSGAATYGSGQTVILGAQVTPSTLQPLDVGGVGFAFGTELLAAGDWVEPWLFIDNAGTAKTFYVGGSPDFTPTWQSGLASWFALEWRGEP